MAMRVLAASKRKGSTLIANQTFTMVSINNNLMTPPKVFKTAWSDSHSNKYPGSIIYNSIVFEKTRKKIKKC
jgi:hypothetical protein